MENLGTQPVALRKAEKPTKAQIRVCGYRSLACHDVANALRRHADLLRQAILADAHWPQEVFLQQLAGRYWLQLAHISFLSVIIDDLDVFGAGIVPPKAKAKLIVDSIAVLAGAIAFQRL
jgi:hypothetical protein